MKKIIKCTFSYVITLLIWVLIFFIIEQTRKNDLLSIDTIITSITLLSLTFQNLKVEEIKFIQDHIASKISIYQFAERSWHLFLCLGIFIFPLLIYEPQYLDIKDNEIYEYNKLGKQFIVLALMYSVVTYFLTFLGRDIDNSTKNSVTRKYGVFYGILFSLYITIKWTATR